MHLVKLKATVASATLAIAIFGASIASAATVSYNQFVTGDDLGGGTQATLTYVQNGNDVDFSLTNLLNSLATSFISSIGFTYTGNTPNSVTNLTGSQANVTGLGPDNSLIVPGKGLSIDFAALFTTNNSGGGANRLVNGETALFRILNAQASLFDFSPFKTGIRGQGLAGGGSTKYTTGDDDGGTGLSPVPVPAGLPMLLSAVLGMAYLRKRKLKA
jgi:hypothetical protein